MIQVTLPLPPSTNNLYVNLKRGGRAKSAPYKSWLKLAEQACVAAYIAAGKPEYPEKAKMRLTVRVGASYRRDVTNCVKPVEDALCAFLPIPDDRYNDHISIARDLDCEGFVICRIEPVDNGLGGCELADLALESERPGLLLAQRTGPDQQHPITEGS